MEFRGDDLHGAMLISSTDYVQHIHDDLLTTARIKYSHWDAEQSGEINNVLNPEVYFSWSGLKNNLVTAGTDFRYTKFARSAVLEHSMNALGAFVQDEIELDKLSFLAAFVSIKWKT